MTDPVIAPRGPHGGDGPRLARALGVTVEDVTDLSVSLNPCAPDVTGFVARYAGTVRQYPDVRPAQEALADAIGVDPDRLVLTNGGAEAIALVAAELPVGHVEDPDFSLYARHLSRLDTAGCRWASNPRNPTGRLAPATARSDVWDEAFYPLATGTWTRSDPDAVVVGSLTKLFACPGLRVGYVVTPDDELARRVRDRQPEWAVSSLAVAVVPELLATADLLRWSDHVAVLRDELVAVLGGAGLTADPSDANYVLVRHAPGLREHLARHRVLVRDTTTFGITGGARIAVPDPAGLDALRRALERWTPCSTR
ncbi:MAG TPA: aminotransferase class I/II-fold pyridoxal phosphate-dependent enzyme [Acidimicrobiia bacterium]|nr:aminotransferase class I/II-fold pyridoxal phosphate-dependent enzyme [Acidimicrobiia bacterium]